MLDRYPTTNTVTCDACGWQYSQTGGQPATCPACERTAKMAELNRVLEKERKP